MTRLASELRSMIAAALFVSASPAWAVTLPDNGTVYFYDSRGSVTFELDAIPPALPNGEGRWRLQGAPCLDRRGQGA
jgi:hypothetical protein